MTSYLATKAARAIWSSSTKAANNRKPPENKAADEKEVLMLQASSFSQSYTSSNMQQQKVHASKVITVCCIFLSLFKILGIDFRPLARGTANSINLDDQAWTSVERKKPLSSSLPSSLQGSHLVINGTRLMSCGSTPPRHSGFDLVLPGLIFSPHSHDQVTCKLPQVALGFFSEGFWIGSANRLLKQARWGMELSMRE